LPPTFDPRLGEIYDDDIALPSGRNSCIGRGGAVLFTIGLTGGISSGKSTVADLLARHGASVIDVDKLAHETYAPTTPGFAAVREAFGPAIVGAAGEIDRRALGRIVFADAAERRRLTDIVWPLLRERLAAIIAERRGDRGVLVFDAAVLFEAGWQDLFDEVWVVTAPPDVVHQRLIARDGLSPEAAAGRVAALLPDEARVARADVVIDNSGSREALSEQVERAWARLFARTL
jgi:dephospho-CoA kinase